MYQSDNQLSYWNLDSTPFQNEEDDEGGLFDIRQQVLRIIAELLEKLGNSVVDQVVNMVVLFLSNESDKSLSKQLQSLGVKDCQVMHVAPEQQWR